MSLIKRGLFELARRHVLRVAAGYAVFAFIVIQVANNYFPALGLPHWMLRVVAYATLAGFPVAIILAWIFDLTPEGVKRTAAGVLGSPGGEPAEVSRRSPGVTAAKSIAVLPFHNMSGDPEIEYFCDGMTEELLNALTRVPGLMVASRTSSFAFKGKQQDIREIAGALNVNTIVEGSVRRSGDRIRITGQLINAADGYHLWSDRFDRDMSDVFAVQDEIADGIVRALEVTLIAGKADLVQRGTKDQDAYHAYLRGRHFWNQRALQKAIGQFEQAIALDADYALAYCGLADAYAFLGFYGYLPTTHAHVRAQAAAERAVAADPLLPEAHYSLGLVEFMFSWKFDKAELSFRRALELNPRLANAFAQLAQLYGSAGLSREAMEAGARAQDLDPLSTLVKATVGLGYLMAGQPAQGAQTCRAALEIDPHYTPAFWVLGACLSELDQHEDAIAACQNAVTFGQRNVVTLMWLGAVQAAAGKAEDARLTLREMEQIGEGGGYLPPAVLAWVLAGLGEHERAVDLALKALEQHNPQAVMLRALHVEPIASDSRYTAAIQELGLTSVGGAHGSVGRPDASPASRAGSGV